MVVSDVKMPRMDGLELHQRLRALPEHRNTPFIFLTGVNDVTEVAACTRDCDLILQKPFPVSNG